MSKEELDKIKELETKMSKEVEYNGVEEIELKIKEDE